MSAPDPTDLDAAPAPLRRPVGGFLLAGGAGFAIDAGLTAALVGLGVAPLLARLPAIFAALFVTWRLNRALAFAPAADGPLAEFGRYLMVSAGGAGLNMLVYMLIVAAAPANGAPVAGVAVVCGSAAAMLFNFLGYRSFAFGAPDSRRG